MINSYFYKYGFEQLNDVISYKDAKELGNMSPPNYILTHLYQA